MKVVSFRIEMPEENLKGFLNCSPGNYKFTCFEWYQIPERPSLVRPQPVITDDAIQF